MPHPFLKPKPILFAHRGDSYNFPENTFLAFENAIKIGVDVIETDVHLSKDNEVVIWHDDSFFRMTGVDKKVSQLDWADIQLIDAGSLFSKDDGVSFPFKNKGVRPILLREALEQFPTTRFNIDLKNNSSNLVSCYVKVLEKTRSANRVLTASFFDDNLILFRKKLPQALTCLGKKELRKLILLNKLNLGFLKKKYYSNILQIPVKSGFLKIITKKFIKQMHSQGFQVQVWTINDPNEMKQLLQLGVDGLFTDRPQLLKMTIDGISYIRK